jgi:hypothetical protein
MLLRMLIARARRDAKMRARIVAERPLIYDRVEGAAGDHPPHVRSGSGIAWAGDRMVVIQDDADYVALIDPARVLQVPAPGSAPAPPRSDGESVVGVRLKSPLAVKGAGGPRARPHLEAVLTARDWRGELILAFGSGTRPERRFVARVRLGGGDTELSVFEARKLYAALEEHPTLATTTLNIEGAAYLPKGLDGRDAVRLFHRANGKPRPGVAQPSSALPGERTPCGTIDVRLDALAAYLDRCRRDPNATLGTELSNPRRYDLDDVDGVPLTFTDATRMSDGRIVYVAAAERSEDAGQDGETLGVALGVIETDGSLRYTRVVERDGQETRRKADGLAVAGPQRVFLVAHPGSEPEDDERPSVLCALDVTGL